MKTYGYLNMILEILSSQIRIEVLVNREDHNFELAECSSPEFVGVSPIPSLFLPTLLLKSTIHLCP